MVNSSPKYSISRFNYYFRVVGPLGIKTSILECTEAPWTEIPLHHPFIDLASLGRVQDSLQVCVLGIVTHQPGLVHRETTWGAADVCNAVLRQGRTEIRCGFWRRHGEELAEHVVGEAVALMRKGDSWELFANESTVVQRCPGDLAEALRDSTDISEGVAAPTSLTCLFIHI